MKNNFYTQPLPLVLWTLAMLFVSSMPGNKLPEAVSFWQWDKVAHGVEFFIFTILLFRFTFLYKQMNYTKSLYLCFFAGLGYALFDELHQIFIPYRFCTWQDLVADFIGIAGGTYIIHRSRKKYGFHDGNNH